MKIFAKLVFIALLIPLYVEAQKTVFPVVTNTARVSILYDKHAPELDSIVANLLAQDIQHVTGFKPAVITDRRKANGNIIVIGSIQSPVVRSFMGRQAGLYRQLNGKWESFALAVVDKPSPAVSKALVIAGSDPRGTAYGVFTLSEKIGVSPWHWWADVQPKRQKELIILQDNYVSSPPAVKYRGIFINDEDWGLQPWAAKTFEPETNDIGPNTYAKVFELLLRLKANLIWPAMHPSTKAFFHYAGNVKTAANYGMVIGSSHAEPMLRNNVGEWDAKTMGPFNYLTNKGRIHKYWEDRVKESRKVNGIYSVGMRGVHDGQMEGVKDLKEAVPIVERIIRDQRELLAKHIGKDVSNIPQVLTPYKEVLEIYDNGLKVPDDVTLVWPDDNYGYIHRLNNEKELKRKGGAGVYYHASYWGRPHDYLWLPSTHPSLVREEMMKAYETGADRLWVLNVGDIKPQEYNIQQFLDMAYNPAPFRESSYSRQHLLRWVTATFGKEQAQEIESVLWEYFQLAFQRRPEFMGWSQTEPTTNTTYTAFNHFYFGDEAQKRIDMYDALESTVKRLRSQIDAGNRDAFYQLVYYPVVCASLINKKFLYRDKSYFYSKQNRLSAHEFAALSQRAYDSIVKATTFYNSTLSNGKWKDIMSMNPRNLPVYQSPVLPPIGIDSINGCNIAPEGFISSDSSLTGNSDNMSLPPFDDLNRQKYFIDVFISKNHALEWTASASHDWIRVSETSGRLDGAPGNSQTRVWIDVNWSNFAKNETERGAVTFSAGGRQVAVTIQATRRNSQALSAYKGFIENNGFISIYAAHFTRQTNRSLNQWKIVRDIGYTGSVVQAFPLSVNSKLVSSPDSIKASAAVVEYDFHTFSSAIPFVTVFALPTHPINNNYRSRYGVSVDDGPVKVVDAQTFGRSEEWKQNVLRNRAERKIEMPFLQAGKHTLKLYVIDPGIMVDEIRIDLGGLKKAYSSIPETVIKKQSAPGLRSDNR
jgi:hypothetical protein